MGTHPIFESDFDCLTERTYRQSDTWLIIVETNKWSTVLD